MPGEGSLEVRERGGRESWTSASTPPRGIPPHHHIAIIAPPVQPGKLHFSHPTPAINDEHFSEQRDATNGIARRGVLGGGKS